MTSTVRRNSHSALSAALIPSACLAFPGSINAQEIAVQNESGVTVRLTASDIAALPHQAVSVHDHGQKVKFEGVPLRTLLEKAGVTFGESLRGKRMAGAFWWKRRTGTAWCLRCRSWIRHSPIG